MPLPFLLLKERKEKIAEKEREKQGDYRVNTDKVSTCGSHRTEGCNLIARAENSVEETKPTLFESFLRENKFKKPRNTSSDYKK